MFWLADVFNGSYSREELQRIERWAHQKRAEAIQGLFSTITGGLAAGTGRVLKATVRSTSGGYRRVRRWQRRRAAIRELNGLSDHVLTDIGLSRAAIREAVDAMLDRETQSRTTVQRVAPVSAAPSRAGDGTSAGEPGDREWRRAA